MSYIPSVHNKFNEDGSRNEYWEGRLGDDDKNYIRGYDTAVNEIQELFLMASDIEYTNVNTKIVSEVTDGHELTDDERMSLNPETLAVLGIREKITECLEQRRNSIVVNFLENLDKYPLKEEDNDETV